MRCSTECGWKVAFYRRVGIKSPNEVLCYEGPRELKARYPIHCIAIHVWWRIYILLFLQKVCCVLFSFFFTFTVRMLPFHHTQPLHFLLLDRLIGLVDRLHCWKVTCTFDDGVGPLWLCRIPCTQGVKVGAQHTALWNSCAIHLTLACLSKRPWPTDKTFSASPSCSFSIPEAPCCTCACHLKRK